MLKMWVWGKRQSYGHGYLRHHNLCNVGVVSRHVEHTLRTSLVSYLFKLLLLLTYDAYIEAV